MTDDKYPRRWPDGSPKTPDAIAEEVTGHTYGCNCLRCDKTRAAYEGFPLATENPHTDFRDRIVHTPRYTASADDLAALVGYAREQAKIALAGDGSQETTPDGEATS